MPPSSAVAVTWHDLLILADIQPGQQVRLEVPVASWVSVSGHFSDGSSFSTGRSGRMVDNLAVKHQPVRIGVKDSGVEITKAE